MIVCPLVAHTFPPPCCGPPINSPDATPAVPCCAVTAAAGPILPACCGTVAPCSVSISATPNPATRAQSVTISGTVVGGAAAGMTVALWQELPGATSFSQVGNTTTAAAGDYSISAPGTVQTNRQWYVTVGALQSATLSEQVAADVTLVVARGPHSATVRGAVTPKHAGERVMLQRQVRGKWITIGQPRLSRKSKFSVRYRGTPRVKATLRAVLGADSTNMRSVSSAVTAVVLPRVTAGPRM
jgi:hypothetical protein